MSVDPKLMAMLVCPACHGELDRPEPEGIECRRCGRVYPIRDDIPVMLVEEASAPTREMESD